MAVSLTQPSIGSTSWGTAVNTNFGTIQTKLNDLGCKAWVFFDGTGTPSILAGVNVSSITDNGTGRYTVNLSITMSSTSYAVVAGGANRTSTGSASHGEVRAPINATTTSFDVVVKNDDTDSYSDLSGISLAVFGAD